MKYELHIGEVYDLSLQGKVPKQTIIISEEQMWVIDKFSNQKKDSDLNTIYILNDCEFKMYPHFEIKNALVRAGVDYHDKIKKDIEG